MKLFLDWSRYRDQGMGDAYADIPQNCDSAAKDMARAVSVCIKSGLCMQFNSAVKCPSFTISGRKEYSPSGRVILLKKWLNGNLDKVEQATLDSSMEKCVGCKRCKRECEGSIDMPMLKAEYSAQRNKAKGKKLRNYIIASAPYWFYRFPWFASFFQQCSANNRFQKVFNRLLGLDEYAIPPKIDLQRLPQGCSKTQILASAERKKCVLWVDVLTAVYRGGVVEKALSLLTAHGYLVHVVTPSSNNSYGLMDSGRSHFSKSQFSAATKLSGRLLRHLQPFADKHIPIVGLEPSSLLMLRDELLMLNHGEAARKVANVALLFEEFLNQELRAKRFDAKFKPSVVQNGLKVHPHCHQRAAGAMKSVRRLLKLIPNLSFSIMDTHCCGAGGSFYLEKETAKLAACMYQGGVAAHVADAPEVELMSNGVGCRSLLEQYEGKTSLHLVDILYQHIQLN